MKVKKTITEILKNQTITDQFDFSGSCPDKDGETVSFSIFSTAFFLNEINHNFFNRVAFVDSENSYTDFLSMFTQWKTDRGPLYARMAYAYSLGYNPIENYSSIEVHTGDDSYENHKTTTHTWTNDKLERAYDAENPLKVQRAYDAENPLKLSTSHTNDKEVTTYTNLTDTDKSYKFGINSATKVQQGENENTKSGSESLEFQGTRDETTTGKYNDTTTGKYSDTHTGSYSDANTGTDKTIYNSTLKKSGNIGIQTAAEMTQKLYDSLRDQDLGLRAVFDFLDRFTFYSEGVDIVW